MAHIHFKNGYFLGLGSWEERTIWKAAGFRFSQIRKAWITDRQDIAESVQGVSWTEQALAQIEHTLSTLESSVELSYASDTDYFPPVPQGVHPRTGEPFALFPYQRAGVQYAMQRKDTLVADQPGLGKSPMGVVVCNADANAHQILVVCPASLKEHWRREFELWKTKPWTVGIAETKFKEKVQDGYYKNGKPKFKTVVHETVWPETDVVIINYDILGRFADQIKGRGWDVLICDEAHALKTSSSGRTLFVLGGRKRNKVKGRWETEWFTAIEASRRVFLTGTPILNRPYEIWPIVKSCDPSGLGKDETTFGYRYCGGFFDVTKGPKGGYNFSGASNEEELGQKLRGSFVIRRLKKDVLPELPGKFRQVVILDTPEIRDIVAREDELAQALKLYEDIVRYEHETTFERDARLAAQIIERSQLMKLGDGVDESEKADWRYLDMDYAKALTGLEPPAIATAFEEIATVRRELGMAKIGASTEWIKNFLDGGEKLVVFGYHTDVLKALNDNFQAYNSGLIYGGVNPRKRQPIVDRFQDDESSRVIFLQHDSGGVGYTLTRARDCAFVEGDWTPTKLEQDFDRICRIGQKAEKLMGFFLVANGSLDCKMANRAFEKEESINAVLDS